jgi:hypothetical protein
MFRPPLPGFARPGALRSHPDKPRPHIILAATKRALVRRQGAVLYGLRIGYPEAYRVGGRFTIPQR